MRAFFVALLLAVFVPVAPQNQAPRLRILQPTSTTYVADDLVIRAAIEPAAQSVRQMMFFVDDRLVCRVETPPFDCPWRAGRQLREHIFRVVAVLSDGRRTSDTVRVNQGLEVNQTVDVDRVMVTVSVMDGEHFVRGLPHSAFRVYDDGVRQKTMFFPPQQSTLELVVGADMSQSMADAIEGVKENVKRFVSALRPADRVTVASFNERYYVLSEPTVDLPARLKGIDRLAAWGMTSLYETVLRSFDILGKQTASGRRALVIFTDGEDTSSRVPREAVEKRAGQNEAVLFVIGQGQVLQSASLRNLCERLAEKSGGRAFFPKDLTELTAAFDAIVEELSNQYLLTFEPASSDRDGRSHRLRVEVDGHYEIHAPPSYVLKRW